MTPALPRHSGYAPDPVPVAHPGELPEPAPADRAPEMTSTRVEPAAEVKRVEPVGESGEGARRRAGADEWQRRRMLERRLHDGASLRVSALALRLGLLSERAPDEATGWRARIDELQDELHAVLQELRDVAREIYPPLLDQAGLAAALRELVDQAGLAVTLEVPEEARFGAAAEGAAYFAVADCLAARACDATPISRIEVARADSRAARERDHLVLRVHGVSAPDMRPILDQARPLGGTAELVEDGRSGTGTITVRIPCE